MKRSERKLTVLEQIGQIGQVLPLVTAVAGAVLFITHTYDRLAPRDEVIERDNRLAIELKAYSDANRQANALKMENIGSELKADVKAIGVKADLLLDMMKPTEHPTRRRE